MKLTVALVITLAILASPASRLFAQDNPSPLQLSESQKEEFLRNGRIVKTKSASKGVTGTTRVTLTDGSLTHDAHVQCIDESKHEFVSDRGTELNFKDSYRFNIAAYRLSRLLGIENLPVTVERRVGGKACAIDWWVDDVMMDEAGRKAKKMQAPDTDSWNNQMYVVRVFDQLIYNVDRNLTNLLILKNWDIVMIDHSRSFRLMHTLENSKNLIKCDRTLLENLRALNKAEVAARLMPYCNRLEVDAVMARRDVIVQFFADKVKEQGEGAVLYDLHRIKNLRTSASR